MQSTDPGVASRALCDLRIYLSSRLHVSLRVGFTLTTGQDVWMVMIPEPDEQTPRHDLGGDTKRSKSVWLRLLVLLGTIALTLVIFVGVVSGFTYQLWGEQGFFAIVNQTDQSLVVVSIAPNGNELELDTLEPGERFSGRTGDCQPTEIVVRTTEGDLYARQPYQRCADDIWTVT